MTPVEVFTTTVEYIKVKEIPLKKKEVETVKIDTDDGNDVREKEISPPETETTSTILKELGKDYNELLLFL